MLKTRISLVALAMIAATQAQANDQADSKGFIEDSHANVLLRNAYINRDKKHGTDDQVEWGQAFIANFSSGFTQAPSALASTHSACTPCALMAAKATTVAAASTSSSRTKPPMPKATPARRTTWPVVALL